MSLCYKYEKVSNKITVEEIEYFSDRDDLQDKYDMRPTDEAIIVKKGEKFKILNRHDLSTTEFETYKHFDITSEERTDGDSTEVVNIKLI